MSTIIVNVHRATTGDYWTEVHGDTDALVAVSVTHHWPEHIGAEPETVYQNDACIDLWEDYHLNGGPNPNGFGELEDQTMTDHDHDDPDYQGSEAYAERFAEPEEDRNPPVHIPDDPEGVVLR